MQGYRERQTDFEHLRRDTQGVLGRHRGQEAWLAWAACNVRTRDEHRIRSIEHLEDPVIDDN